MLILVTLCFSFYVLLDTNRTLPFGYVLKMIGLYFAIVYSVPLLILFVFALIWRKKYAYKNMLQKIVYHVWALVNILSLLYFTYRWLYYYHYLG